MQVLSFGQSDGVVEDLDVQDLKNGPLGVPSPSVLGTPRKEARHELDCGPCDIGGGADREIHQLGMEDDEGNR